MGGDNVVRAVKGDTELLGAFTLEGLGLAADPVKKVLVPTIGMALVSQESSRPSPKDSSDLQRR